jgi:hypothetical protein
MQERSQIIGVAKLLIVRTVWQAITGMVANGAQ